MLRNLFILVVFACGSAALAVAYQNNPQALEHFLRPTIVSTPETAGSATTAASGPQPLGRKVLVPSDGRGHFQAAFKINGRQTDALIDTGATVVALNASTARRAGIALNAGDFTSQVDTANGRTKAAIVSIDTLQIGKIILNDVQAVVLDDNALRTNLIGMSFLNRLDKYQVENGALLLVQ